VNHKQVLRLGRHGNGFGGAGVHSVDSSNTLL
jgi:hypothetical protein